MTQLTGYKRKLKEVYARASKNEQFEGTMTEWMKADYPGNYTVQECYIPERMCWGAKMVFESEEDEIWFLLKWE